MLTRSPRMGVLLALIILVPVLSLARNPEPLAVTPVDTLDLFGGPGTLEGKFETADGEADVQGWTTSDGTVSWPDRWQVSTFNAAALDPEVPGNHAWWCGALFDPCFTGDTPEGYGNDWNQSLGWEGTALDPTLPATVRVTGILNSDTEPGYDFVCLVYDVNAIPDIRVVLELDGIHTGYQLDEVYTYEPDEYLDTEGRIQVRVQFESDAAWSDEDCLYPSAGAVQIDNLQVTISQEGQPDQVSPVETCEPGDPSVWTPLPSVGYGNYAQLWSGLEDEDPDVDNASHQWAFIDDGIVQPGTGPTHCNQGEGCYGPDSCVVDIYGGLIGNLDEGLRNHVTSPVIALPPGPAGDLEGLLLSADAYFHSDLTCGMVMTLKMDILSTSDPAGETGWSGSALPFHFYGGDPEYRRLELHVPEEGLAEDARFVKIQITADDIRTWWCWSWLWSTPAPYFDNVRLQALVLDPLSPSPETPAPPTVLLHPNPFNPRTTLTLENPRYQQVRVAVYDLRGRRVADLMDAFLERGRHILEWMGKDRQGRDLPSGDYFFRVQLGEEMITRKVLLVR